MAKNSLKLIKKYLGELILVIGSGIFVYNVFNFSSLGETVWICENSYSSLTQTLAKICSSEIEKVAGVAYFYPNNVIKALVVGVVLIVIGILIIRSKKINKISKLAKID